MIIPAYGSAATIRRAVDSALSQTHAPAEIIVVDDGSPDEQVAVIEQAYGHRVTLLRKPNGGAASARNMGIDRSAGRLHRLPGRRRLLGIRQVVSAALPVPPAPKLGLVAGAFYEEIPGMARAAQPNRSGPRSWYERVLKLGGIRAVRLATMIWTSTVLLRRDSLGEERFVPGLEPAEDRDLWIRIVVSAPGLSDAAARFDRGPGRGIHLSVKRGQRQGQHAACCRTAQANVGPGRHTSLAVAHSLSMGRRGPYTPHRATALVALAGSLAPAIHRPRWLSPPRSGATSVGAGGNAPPGAIHTR